MFSTHLKTYPIVTATQDLAMKVPGVKPARDYVKPHVEWVRSTEPMKLVLDAADSVANRALDGLDWTVAWVVPKAEVKVDVKPTVQATAAAATPPTEA